MKIKFQERLQRLGRILRGICSIIFAAPAWVLLVAALFLLFFSHVVRGTHKTGMAALLKRVVSGT